MQQLGPISTLMTLGNALRAALGDAVYFQTKTSADHHILRLYDDYFMVRIYAAQGSTGITRMRVTVQFAGAHTESELFCGALVEDGQLFTMLVAGIVKIFAFELQLFKYVHRFVLREEYEYHGIADFAPATNRRHTRMLWRGPYEVVFDSSAHRQKASS